MRAWVAERLTRRFGRIVRRRERHDRQRIAAGSRLGRQDLPRSRRSRRAGRSVVSRSDPGVRRVPGALPHRRHRRRRPHPRIARTRARPAPTPSRSFSISFRTFRTPRAARSRGPRRETVVRICEHFGLPIVEDDPYGELRFEGDDLPPLVARETTAPIIYSGTGSKIMAPGMRIAWLVIADEEIREKIVLAKQGADLHSGTFAQYVFHAYASNGGAFDRPRSQHRGDLPAPPRRDGRGAGGGDARRRPVHAPRRRNVPLGDRSRRRHYGAAAHLGPVESRVRARASTSIRDATFTTGCG